MFLAFAATLMHSFFFIRFIVTNVAFHQNGNPCPAEQQGQLLARSQKSVTDFELEPMLPDLSTSRHNEIIVFEKLTFSHELSVHTWLFTSTSNSCCQAERGDTRT